MNSFITQTCLPPQKNASEELVQYSPINTTLVIVGWNQMISYGINSGTLQQTVVAMIDHNDAKCINNNQRSEESILRRIIRHEPKVRNYYLF